MNRQPYSSCHTLFKALKHPSKAADRVKRIIFSTVIGPLLSPFRKGNIVVFHIGRSGSTVLGDILNQHPRIFWDSEIYERLLPQWTTQVSALDIRDLSEDPLQFLKNRMRQAGSRFYGFEVKFFQLKLLNLKLSDYINDLQKLGVNYFIILERKNYLRAIVSSVIAHQTLLLHQSKQDRPKLHQVKLEIDNIKIDRNAKPLISYLWEYHEDFRKLEKFLSGKNVLKLSYEDDVMASPLSAYERVCNFIGIESRKVSVRFSKTNPFKLREIITNFEEVEQTLSGTLFEWMLYE